MTNSPHWGITSNFHHIYFNPIEALEKKKVTQDVVDSYFERMRIDEPMNYYIHYIRYLRNVVVVFNKRSLFAKIILMLSEGEESSEGFIYCKIDDLDKLIKVHMSFLDLIKIHLLVKLKGQFGLSDSRLQFIFLALRYDVNVVPMCRNGKSLSENTYRSMRDETMHSLWDTSYKGVFDMDTENIPDDIKAMKKEIDTKGAYVFIKYKETDNFERLLYYALNYRKSAYLSINLNPKLTPVVYFLNGSDIGHLEDGIVINILRLLLRLQVSQGERGPSASILQEEGMSHIQGKQRKEKEKYIDGLIKEAAELGIHKMGMIDQTENERKSAYDKFKNLSAQIDKAKIELDFGLYDVDEGDKQIEYDDWAKHIEDFLSHKLNGEYKLEVHQGRVKTARADFSTSELSNEKYQELKEYVAGYGHVAPDENVGIVTRYVGEKRHKYGKNEADN